jgi:hypothetical protein
MAALIGVGSDRIMINMDKNENVAGLSVDYVDQFL